MWKRYLADLAVPVVDCILAPLVFASALLMKVIRRPGIWRMPVCKAIIYRVGIYPIRDHYYEPMFNYFAHLFHSLREEKSLSGQNTNFFAGAYYCLQYLVKYWIWLAALAVANVACAFSYIGNIGKYGDFSYGIYIVHFPILQILIAYVSSRESPWTMLVVASSLVLTVAFLFWHFIEKPFLRKSSHYVAVNKVGLP